MNVKLGSIKINVLYKAVFSAVGMLYTPYSKPHTRFSGWLLGLLAGLAAVTMSIGAFIAGMSGTVTRIFNLYFVPTLFIA